MAHQHNTCPDACQPAPARTQPPSKTQQPAKIIEAGSKRSDPNVSMNAGEV
jgi:hypothetical protein